MSDFAYRELQAQRLLGVYEVKTAGGLMDSRIRSVTDGWIYATTNQLLFLADRFLVAPPSDFSTQLDARTLLVETAGRPFHLTAPMIALNGIIDFGGGLEFVGAKKQMKQIATLLRT